MSVAIVYLNVIVGAAAFTIYGMWAGKWLRRKAWNLFFLNAATSIIVGLFALGYAVIANDYAHSDDLGPSFFRYLIPFVIGVPVWARITEYRRDERREQFARGVVKHMRRLPRDHA